MKNPASPLPAPSEPAATWPHRPLWDGVKNALMALPAHFHSDTFIEGVDATDVFTLNSALGATIESQVVATLNAMRSVWDKADTYRTYTFVRQPQSFPDVVLRNLADKDEPPLMGIELKGWYLLAKEGEPSLRFTQTEAACADADLIMVVPWVLSSVISGRPRIYTPYIVRRPLPQPLLEASTRLLGQHGHRDPRKGIALPEEVRQDGGQARGGWRQELRARRPDRHHGRIPRLNGGAARMRHQGRPLVGVLQDIPSGCDGQGNQGILRASPCEGG